MGDCNLRLRCMWARNILTVDWVGFVLGLLNTRTSISSGRGGRLLGQLS